MRHIPTRLALWSMFVVCVAGAIVATVSDGAPHWLKWVLGWAAAIFIPDFRDLFARDKDLDASTERMKREFEQVLRKSEAKRQGKDGG